MGHSVDAFVSVCFTCSGTRFKLLSDTANTALKVSEDKNSVQYPVETYNKMSTFIE